MRIGLLAGVGEMIDSFFPPIIERWEEAGHEVFPAAGNLASHRNSHVIEGLTRRPSLSLLRTPERLREWAEGLDVVLTNSGTASAAVRLSRLEAPVVYFCHGLHWNRGNRPLELLWRAVEGSLAAKAAGVIVINSDDERWFRARMQQERLVRLTAGVGLDCSDYPTSPVPSGELTLAWIGEFSPRKRPWLALQVAEELKNRGIGFRLQMAGRGPLLEAMRQQIRARELNEHVETVGYGDSADILTTSHALVHTASWEGLPRVMLESLAVGRHMFAFDVKGVRDVPEAVLIPDGDVSAMADRIIAQQRSGALEHGVNVDVDALSFQNCADAISAFLERQLLPTRRESAGPGAENVR